jgi:Transglutaminase-like superfamily
MGKLRHLLKRSPVDLLLLVRVAARLLIVDCGLRLLSVQRLHAAVAGTAQHWRTPQISEEQCLTRLVWAVDVSGRYVGASCLQKTLALQWLLSRRGVPTRLWIGVQPGEATLRAHAWLEYDGQVIIGGAVAKNYTPLHCFDGGDAFATTSGDPRKRHEWYCWHLSFRWPSG